MGENKEVKSLKKIHWVLFVFACMLLIFAGFLVETFIRTLNVESLPAVEGPNYIDYITDPGLFPQGGEVTVIDLPYDAGDKWLIHTGLNETEFQQYVSAMFINDTLVAYSEYRYNVNWGLYQVYLPHDFLVENYGSISWILTVVDVNSNEKNMFITT